MQSVILFVLLALASGCAKNQLVIGDAPAGERPPVDVSAAIHDAAFDAPLAVTGTVKEVCPDDGCWLVLTDRANLLRVELKEGLGEVPRKWMERRVRADGTLGRTVVLPSSKGYAEYERLCGAVGDVSKPTAVLTARRLELLEP
ncbi:MAG: hypothetical protein ACKOAG_10060 [Candidatus Kapaibacterium sp.]